MKLPVKRAKISSLSFIDEVEESAPIKKFLKNPEISKKIIEETQKIEEIKKNYEKEQLQESTEQIELSFAY